VPTVSASTAISVADVVKRFGTTVAVDRASLTVGAGEIVALLGPSGSGKTTLLRVIAGFERPDAGTVAIAGRPVVGPDTWVEPDRRRIGMVFQDGALFPHLTVAENVAFGRPRPGVAETCLDLVGLADRARAHPHELSGGERQRVALARALAIEPDVVLLDEPFASLDAGLRVSLRAEVAGILRDAGTSALLVTHDQDEALSLADVVTVMRDGRVEQSGPPEEIYHRPATRWVARFLGAANILPGVVDGELVECELGRAAAAGEPAGAVDVVVRPESVVIGTADAHDVPAHAPRARVVERSFHGHDALVRLALPSGAEIGSRTTGRAPWRVGDEVRVWVDGPLAVLAGDDPGRDGAGVDRSAAGTDL
jgi:iron(III) transport system ATP-binding protein